MTGTVWDQSALTCNYPSVVGGKCSTAGQTSEQQGSQNQQQSGSSGGQNQQNQQGQSQQESSGSQNQQSSSTQNQQGQNQQGTSGSQNQQSSGTQNQQGQNQQSTSGSQSQQTQQGGSVSGQGQQNQQGSNSGTQTQQGSSQGQHQQSGGSQGQNQGSSNQTVAQGQIVNNQCVAEGFVQNENDCKKFYRCVSDGRNGYIKYEFSCGEGTVWDEATLACNYPSAVHPNKVQTNKEAVKDLINRVVVKATRDQLNSKTNKDLKVQLKKVATSNKLRVDNKLQLHRHQVK
ncbi:hypothetical protein NQ318_014042 [Aromia moschata]|uniref:Chitin-binding type-2 domain-containing protein n=1 Tax=Aromia moschata TaxID=1265417 RepID=A0AAV8YZP7_9CUCU|nr:hypothetical protein NQ318_014042 [Aromia moschata]